MESLKEFTVEYLTDITFISILILLICFPPWSVFNGSEYLFWGFDAIWSPPQNIITNEKFNAQIDYKILTLEIVSAAVLIYGLEYIYSKLKIRSSARN